MPSEIFKLKPNEEIIGAGDFGNYHVKWSHKGNEIVERLDREGLHFVLLWGGEIFDKDDGYKGILSDLKVDPEKGAVVGVVIKKVSKAEFFHVEKRGTDGKFPLRG